MVGTLNFLDFQQMLLWDIAGGNELILFSFLAIIFMGLAARARLPNQITFMMVAVAGLLFGAIFDSLLGVVLIIIAAVIAYLLPKMMYKDT